MEPKDLVRAAATSALAFLALACSTYMLFGRDGAWMLIAPLIGAIASVVGGIAFMRMRR